jgi:hypothetical protein
MKGKSSSNSKFNDLEKNEDQIISKLDNSENAYNKPPKQSARILRIYKKEFEEYKIPTISNWNIKNGDYTRINESNKRKVSKKVKTYKETAILIGFTILVMTLVLFIANWLAEKT